MKKVLVMLVVAVLTVGCCSTCRTRVKNAKPLEGTVWHLVKIGGESLTLPTDEFNIILNENGWVVVELAIAFLVSMPLAIS